MGPVNLRTRLNPPVIFGCRGAVGKLYPTRPLWSVTRHFTPRGHMYGCTPCNTSVKRCICLIELIDANKKKDSYGKGWLRVRRKLIGRRTITLLFLRVARSAAQASFCANLPNDNRHFRAGSHPRYLCNAVHVVVAREAQFTCSQVHPNTMHLCRDAERGETRSDVHADMRRAKVRTAGVNVGCQGRVTLLDVAHELDIIAKPRLYCIYTRMDDHMIISKSPKMRHRGEL